MINKFESYIQSEPEIVFEWNDPETDAIGWLVINSLKGGASGGGTRMRKGLTRQEVTELAKTMEIKFNVCGPPIGGAKSGIDFDPSDPRKKEVLQRWFQAIRPVLKSYYGTAGDLNVDEKTEVSPLLNQIGIIHPQEGVLEGHFQYSQEKKEMALQSLQNGCRMPVRLPQFNPDIYSNRYTTIDLITGFGVAESIRLFYKIYKGQQLDNRRVFIQGWGNVGAAAGWYLARQNARVVLIQDREGFLLDPKGFSFEHITTLMNSKINNVIQDHQKQTGAINPEIFRNLNVEIFIPAAASRLVTENFINQMIPNGLELVSSGANVPFDEPDNIFGTLSRQVDKSTALIPDFIANCGVARLFSYLMEIPIELKEEAIFRDITETIDKAITNIHHKNPTDRNISTAAWELYCS